jgi:hypothetical protein
VITIHVVFKKTVYTTTVQELQAKIKANTITTDKNIIAARIQCFALQLQTFIEVEIFHSENIWT